VSCAELRDLVQAYLDHELDLAKSLEMEQHFRECAICSEAYEYGRRLRTVLNEAAPYFHAPSDLHARIRAAMREEPRSKARARTLGWRAMAFGLPAALTAVIALSIVPLLRRPMTADLLVDEIVSGHVRSLMADHLTDVASSDKHTVKPWFDGKLDFSPAVVDLADHGFPLVGGRLEYLGNRPVAALVYARQKHFINLLVWPSSHEEQPDAPKSPQHGFNVIHWDGSEMTYWAVSDLNPAELGEFAELLKQRTETVTRPG
jgi:mycothiol system anti-sigma-R factor